MGGDVSSNTSCCGFKTQSGICCGRNVGHSGDCAPSSAAPSDLGSLIPWGEKFVPFEPGQSHAAHYYRVQVRALDDEGNDTGALAWIDVSEIAEQLDYLPGCIVKYAVRAGRKPGQPAAKDRAKCAEMAQRWAAHRDE